MHGAAGDAGHVHTEFSYQVVGRLMPTGTAWDRAIIVPIEAVWEVHGLHAKENPPGVPAILIKPKTIADACKLRGEYRSDQTVAVFPGEVLTALYATLGDARQVMSIIALAAQALVAAPSLSSPSHMWLNGAARSARCVPSGRPGAPSSASCGSSFWH
jgi:putative ABC transport system permease protein